MTPRAIDLLGHTWIMDAPPWTMPLGKYIALERRVLERWEALTTGRYETDWPLIAPDVLAPALSRRETDGSTTYDMTAIPDLQRAMLAAPGKQVVAMAKLVIEDLAAIRNKYAELYDPMAGPKGDPEFAKLGKRFGWDGVLDDLATRGETVDLEVRQRLYLRHVGEVMALLIRNRARAKAAENARKRIENQHTRKHGR